MSKGLDRLDVIRDLLAKDNNKTLDYINFVLEPIQKELKALEIINKKNVDMIELCCAEYYYQYNKEVYEKYHDDDMLLTQEEFELLVEVENDI